MPISSTHSRRRAAMALAIAGCLAALFAVINPGSANSAPLTVTVLGQTAETPPASCPGKIVNNVEVTPCRVEGHVTGVQLEWLHDLAADADRPVYVFGHHHVWSPDSAQYNDSYFGIDPDSSVRLVEVVAARPAIRGYFAGHTHRNRVRHISISRDVPWVEVACVKDFPGAWAEYRVFEGGVLQVFHDAQLILGTEFVERPVVVPGNPRLDILQAGVED